MTGRYDHMPILTLDEAIREVTGLKPKTPRRCGPWHAGGPGASGYTAADYLGHYGSDALRTGRVPRKPAGP